MSLVAKVFSGVFILILVYVLATQATGIEKVITALGKPSVDAIKALQGRP